MKGLFALTCIFVLSSCGGSSGVTNAVAGNGQDQEPARQLEKIGELSPSFYWVALEEQADQGPRNRQLLDVNGRVLAEVTEKFFRAIRLEGTGRLLNGTILNYAARIKNPDGTTDIRFRVAGPEAPYGYGVDEIPLIPFRSVAVDPTVVPIGSTLYIPAAIGAQLPDGTKHDGFFYAVDIGDAIKNKRIDVFTSYGDQSAVFRRVGFVHGKFVEVFLVK